MLARLNELIAEAKEIKKKTYRDFIEQGEKEAILLEEDGHITFLPPYRFKPCGEYRRKYVSFQYAEAFSDELKKAKEFYLWLTEPQG